MAFLVKENEVNPFCKQFFTCQSLEVSSFNIFSPNDTLLPVLVGR